MTADEPAAVVAAMEKRGLKRAWLMGGGTLATSFLEGDLITHYSIGVIPLVLGGGVPLFTPPARQTTLTLVGTKAFPNGVVQLEYERA